MAQLVLFVSRDATHFMPTDYETLQNVKELFYTMLPDVRTSVAVGSRRPLVLPVAVTCT
jgi:hypothetical protein